MKKKLLWPLLLSSAVLFGLGSAGNKFEPVMKKDRNNQFVADYIARNDYIKAGSALNAQLADEGMVLLKNKDNLLPFDGVQKISLFGKASVNLQYGGGGSGSGRVNGETQIDMKKSLQNAGYEVNPTLYSFYEAKAPNSNRLDSVDLSEVQRTNGNSNWTGESEATVGECSVSKYTDDVKASFDEYSDAAVVVLARGGTEGADCKTFDARDHDQAHDSNNYCTPESKAATDKHYLELSKNEIDMLAMIKAKFSKIVVLINSGNIFECNVLDTDDAIGAVIWMGTPGAVGAGAVGRILNGVVCPSGRTVDTWTRDFTKDPSFQNFADNSQTYIVDGVAYAQDTMINADGTPTNSSTPAIWKDEAHHVATGNNGGKVDNMLNGVKPSAYVSYEEGIYVDYRYYETRYADMLKKEGADAANTWYNGEEGVIYPFGYGLSYTSFNQKIVSADFDTNTVLTGKKKKMHVTVEVENTGDVAGKEVVQLYWHAPYIDGEIEKAENVLCAFGKTEMLEPGEKENVELEWYIQDVANYDFTDANHNEFMGYELDGGDYRISINKNAHEEWDTRSFKVQEGGVKYENDRFSGHKVENRFTNRGFYSCLPGENDVGFDQMSRHDFVATFPTHPTVKDRTLKAESRAEEFLTHKFTLDDIEKTDTYEYVPEAAHKTKQDIEALGWEQQPTALDKSQRTHLADMMGKDIDDPAWDEFLNEFTYGELQTFVEDGQFHSPALDSIDKPMTSDSDGPSQFATIWWVGAPTVAATFNYELAKQQGHMVGTEAHLGGKYGWFGPAVNTHRSPVGGRNFEYYAADPFLMGRMAAGVVGDATQMGVYCYFKHFAVNDQEKGREGASSYLT
ncbi:MAG: glycoside hydrolase family 3 C-terminal domain-containing protein, partial [Bacilli bacterium]|nr:glycoside hydrolase family 3 C-terminal domain-containing protein [Bacilli bacterium]